MNSSNSSRNKAVIFGAVIGAVGTGVLLAGAGVFLYKHLEQKKKFDSQSQKLASVSKSRRSSISSSGTGTTEYFSAVNSDEEDEFQDCVSDEKLLEIKSRKEKLFNEVDLLMKGDDQDRLRAYTELRECEFEMENDPEFLWRFAKAHQMLASACVDQDSYETKKKHVYEGLKYVKKALSLTQANADVHKWFAILTGMQTEFLPIKEKIHNAFIFQKHLLIAIKMQPTDYSLYHTLGRFKYEVCNTSWVEKKLAASLFGDIPETTFDEAIEDFEKAEELNPTPWKENKLLLAKCYIGKKTYSLAMNCLQSAQEIPPKTKQDVANDREINALIQKYKSYVK